jgi:hypothetical protein
MIDPRTIAMQGQMQAQMQGHDHALQRQRSQQEHEALLAAMDQHHQNELHKLQMEHYRRLAALWQGQEDNPAAYEAILRRNGVIPPEAVQEQEIANAMADGGEVDETPKARVRRALRRARVNMPPQDFTKRKDGGRVY